MDRDNCIWMNVSVDPRKSKLDHFVAFLERRKVLRFLRISLIRKILWVFSLGRQRWQVYLIRNLFLAGWEVVDESDVNHDDCDAGGNE